MAAASPYRLRIEGMDCASCALKIETAMQRLPGVSDINVSYANETLALQLDEDRTALGTIEQKIRALGYTPVIEQTEAKASPPRPPTRTAGGASRWRRTPRRTPRCSRTRASAAGAATRAPLGQCVSPCTTI